MMCLIKKSMLMALVAVGIIFAQSTKQWQNLYPAYSGLAFGNSKFVAVSGDGLIRTTGDGAAWSQYFVSDGGNSRKLYAVAYGGGEFVATQSGTSCLRSGDGSGWYSEGMGFNEPVRYLIYGKNSFVGVGDEGTTYLFDEGAWETYDAKQNGNLSHIAYGADGYVIVGGEVEWSPNAKGWGSATGASVSGGVGVVAFGNGKFVALAKNGGTVLTTDSVKHRWESATANEVPPGMTDMVFGGGKFAAVGKAGKGCVSSDGSSWSAATGLNPNDDFTAVKYGNNTFLALGAKGSVYKSADGKTWTKLAGNSAISYKQIAYGGGKFAAVGDSGVSVSSDGKDWERKDNTKGLVGVAFGANRFVAVGDGGTIISSADGNTWTPYEGVSSTEILTSVAFGSGVFVVGGRDGTEQTGTPIIKASTDGLSWTDQSSSITKWGYGKFPISLCFGKGKFINAIKGTNMIKICEAGTVDEAKYWTDITITALPDGYGLISVAYANEKFVAVGAKATGEAVVLNSADGESWQALPENAIVKKVRSATYAKGAYIAVGDSGNVYAYLSSNNSWHLQGKATNRDLYAIYSATSSSKEIVLAAGAKGAILYTESAPTSVKHASAPRVATSSKTGVMCISRTGRTSAVTLSFTPNSAGTIAVYSLSGRQLYKTRLGAGERSASLPERAVSTGSVIVRYSGGGRVVNQRFQFVR